MRARPALAAYETDDYVSAVNRAGQILLLGTMCTGAQEQLMTIREDAAALRVPWVRPARPGELDGLPVEELWLRNRPAREATELRAPLGLFMRRWMTVAETRDPWAVMELAADQRLSPWAVERAAAATVLRRTLDDAGQLARGASSTRRRVATRSLGLLQQPPSGLTHRVAREDAQTSI